MTKPNEVSGVEAEIQTLIRAETGRAEPETPHARPARVEVTTFPKPKRAAPPTPMPEPWPELDTDSQELTPLPLSELATPEPPAPAAGLGAPPALGQATPEAEAPPERGEHTDPEFHLTDPEPGTRIHHYEVIKLIGRGGMGSVFLGRDTRLGRRVAIKFLRTQSPDLTKRFILEARTTAACSHENIVVIYEVDAWRGSPFMVFEFLQGQPLTKFMPEHKPLAAGRAVELMVPVVRALAYAHSQGVVHRDLKPDNIFVTDGGITKVLDFGIAKVLQSDEKAPEYASRPRAPKSSLEDEDDSELTQKGAMMGTLAYMAPEQWGIGVPIDHRADVWSVGIMLFKMLAGRHPLHPLAGHQLMVTGVLTEPMPLLSTVAPDVPKELANAVDRCLLKHKERRWPDAVSLLRALEPFLPGRFTRELQLDESPYAGLSSFQEHDADRFFGRQLEVAALVNRLSERPLVGIVGPSGAGKSSFVRAGVVPALKRSGDWEAMVVRPGKNPLAALASLVAPLVGTSGSVADDVEEQKKLTERLKTEPGFVGAVLRARARREKKNLLLFVDQFEELYTLVPDAAERWAFTSCLAAVADDVTSPIRLVLSLRSDFLDRVPEDPRFMAELSQGLVFMNSPGTEGLREAIVHPAELAGYHFESAAIVEDMVSHLAATPGALPLLQFAAQKLWENRDSAKKRLTVAGYEAIGGVVGALASHADAVLAKLPPQALPTVRALLLRLVTAEKTRAIVSLEELRELSKDQQQTQRLVDELVQARLLVVQTGAGAGAATVELVHESLIHRWPTLKRWLEESSEDSAFLEQVRSAARQWQQQGRDADLLWRGEWADEAARFERRYRGPLSDSQRAFLEATIALGARAARRRRTLVAGALAVLSALLLAAGLALVKIQAAKNEADQQRAIAEKAEHEAKENLVKAELNAKARDEAAKRAQEAAEQLTTKQTALLNALNEAQAAKTEAQRSEERAVINAAEAATQKARSEAAKQRVEEAMRKVESLRQEEIERRRKLEQQLGSPVIDELK